MKARRRTEITVETHRVLTIKGGRRKESVCCEGCGKQVEMVSADEAAIIARVSSRAIYRWIEAGRLHFVETAEGLVMVCLDSLGSISQSEGNTYAE